jgi:hypothetical protein
MSRMTPGMTIPAGDCRVDWFGGDALPIMAAICPDSAFADMLGNCLAGGWVHELTGTLARSGGLVGMVYGPDDVGESRRVVPTFDHLPQSGKVTITREDEAHGSVRLWLSGNPAGATHVHRDVGQFTLEVGGSPVFVDRGMVQYWHPEAHFLSRSWLHNVLTPIDDRGGFPSQDPPAVAGPMDVSADRSRVRVPGCDVWARWMTRYERRFTFEHPSLILVTDSLTPTSACKVAFHLQSPYPFRIDGANALGRFGDLDVTVCFPWAETVYCRQVLIDLANRPIYHICAISPELRANCELVTEVAIEKYRP